MLPGRCCRRAQRVKALGVGTFGKVWLIKYKEQTYALKQIGKAQARAAATLFPRSAPRPTAEAGRICWVTDGKTSE